MTISTDDGTRVPGDRIIKWSNTPMSIEDIGKILLLMWENEDLRHPPPQRGARMLLDFINELFDTRKITDDLLHKYYLK